MALRGIFFQELLLGALILAAVGATEINSSCIRKCGSVSIPYPFGTTEGCYLNPSFLITCNQTFNPPKPFLRNGSVDVTDISLNGELRVPNWVAQSCNGNHTRPWFRSGKFLVSNTKNKFFAVGCNTVAYIEGRTLQKNFTTGCSSHCDGIDSVVNGSCNGVGCCQSSIPQSITSFDVSFGILNNHFNVQSFNPCSFGFLTEEKAYKFSSLDLTNLQDRKEVPLILDWAVGNESCAEAKKNQTNYHVRLQIANVTISPTILGIVAVAPTAMVGTPTSPMVAKWKAMHKPRWDFQVYLSKGIYRIQLGRRTRRNILQP